MQYSVIDFIYERFLKKHCIIFSALVIISTCVLMMLKAEPLFQMDSESLVSVPMLAEVNDKEFDNSQYGLGSFSAEVGETFYYNYFKENDIEMNRHEYTYGSYISQFGLQGYFCCFIARVIKSSGTVGVMRAVFCLLTVFLTFLIAAGIKKHYGLLPAVCSWIVLIYSHWVYDFAPNLYWAMFTWLVTILLGLMCVNHEDKRKYIYPLFFIAMVVKCLCGYEYISTIMLSGESFLIAEWLVKKEKRRKLTYCIIISGLCMLIGFIAVMLFQSYRYGEGDLIKGFKFFKYYLVERRTFGNYAEYEPVYADSLNASVWAVLKKYFWSLPDGKKITMLLAAGVLSVLIQKVFFRKDVRIKATFVVIQLISALSWIVLAKSHSFIHVHINFIVFYIGFAQVCVYCAADAVLSHIRVCVENDGNDMSNKSKIRFSLVK